MKRYYVPISIIFFLSVSIAQAASSSFQIQTFVSADVTPPTTPTSLSATPVASSQINLSWGASTDDVLLSGYKVFRDSVQIATTTQTNYADAGLTASTTYTYYVKAFDSSFNVSSSSNIVATTTLAPAATATTTPATKVNPGGSGPGNVKLLSFDVVPALYSAQVIWQTNQFAQFELRWGRTSSYELGFVTNQVFEQGNNTNITDLQPGTVYEYELIAYDKNGIRTVLSEGKFKTLDAPDTTAPANVSDLQATVVGDDVRLSWVNPTERDFDHVRVIRNYMFYPVDPFDGYISYQDSGTFFIDQNALAQKNVQYYSVFSYDRSGNVSSGAVVAAYKQAASEGNAQQESQVATSSTLSLSMNDLEFVQDGTNVASNGIDATLPLTIRIKYEKLPEHLKAVIGTLAQPNTPQSTLSFLFKINNDKSYYEVTIAPLKVVGVYSMDLSVYDFTLEQLSQVKGSITVVPHSISNFFGAPLRTTPRQTPLLWLIGGLFVLLLYLFYRVLKDLGYGIRMKQGVDKLKLGLSIMVFCLCGGSCAYVITQLLSSSDASLQNASTQAAVGLSQQTAANNLITLVTVSLVGLLLIFILIYLLRRGK